MVEGIKIRPVDMTTLQKDFFTVRFRKGGAEW